MKAFYELFFVEIITCQSFNKKRNIQAKGYKWFLEKEIFKFAVGMSV
jgi:hypothetical protein